MAFHSRGSVTSAAAARPVASRRRRIDSPVDAQPQTREPTFGTSPVDHSSIIGNLKPGAVSHSTTSMDPVSHLDTTPLFTIGRLKWLCLSAPKGPRRLLAATKTLSAASTPLLNFCSLKRRREAGTILNIE